MVGGTSKIVLFLHKQAGVIKVFPSSILNEVLQFGEVQNNKTTIYSFRIVYFTNPPTMMKTRSLILFFALLLHFQSFSQQRIGADLSTRMHNLMLTVHYQKVLKNRILYSVGVFAGSNGSTFISNDTLRLCAGTPIASPYSNANNPIIDTSGTYSLLDYITTIQSIGVQFGLGYYYEFDVQHGLRINLNSSIGYVGSVLGGYYRSIDNFTEQYATHVNEHFVGSISLEAYHTFRLTGRLTFNYGVKVPYFFTIDKAKFNPTVQRDLLFGFEPQLSIGLTRVIGKCD